MEQNKTLVWAHRGASAYAPENTLAAFEKAVEMKADGVELDVQLSADGVFLDSKQRYSQAQNRQQNGYNNAEVTDSTDFHFSGHGVHTSLSLY